MRKLLIEALKHLKLHNEEYHHITPDELIDRIERKLAMPYTNQKVKELMYRTWGCGYNRCKSGKNDNENEDVHWMQNDVDGLLEQYKENHIQQKHEIALGEIYKLTMNGRVNIIGGPSAWEISIPLERFLPYLIGIRLVLGRVVESEVGFESSYRMLNGKEKPLGTYAKFWEAVHSLLMVGSMDSRQGLNLKDMEREEMNANQRIHLADLADELNEKMKEKP